MNHPIRIFEQLIRYLREKEAMGLIYQSGLTWHGGLKDSSPERFFVLHGIHESNWKKIIRPGIEDLVDISEICVRRFTTPLVNVSFFVKPK